MDRLMREREAFKAAATRNLSTPRESSSAANLRPIERKAPKKKNREHDEAMLKHMKSLPTFEYGGLETGGIKTESSAVNASMLGLMAKIVDFMKKRHLEGNVWPLTLKDCLDEMKAGGIAKNTERWLVKKLPTNPKLQFDAEGKFQFKPPYKFKRDDQILTTLEKLHQTNKGAVLLSELNECFPKAEERMTRFGDEIITIPCLVNKKKDKAYFHNDKAVGIAVDDDFKSLWRTSNVEALDEKKIEEYLNKHGLSIIKDNAAKRLIHGPPKRKGNKRKSNVRFQNVHMPEGLLQNYQLD